MQSMSTPATFNVAMLSEFESFNELLRKNFGISIFTYRRFSKAGKLLHITTHEKWLDHSFERGLYFSQDVYHKFSQIHKKKDGIFLWKENLEDPLYSALFEFDIWNGITFYRDLGECIEIIAFNSDKNFAGASNFYINNLDLLRYSMENFRSRVHQKIKNIHMKNIEIDVKPYRPNTSAALNHRPPSDFFKSTCLRRHYLMGEFKDVYLTTREAQVLYWMSRGKRTKDIARILFLSPRTIEHYWNCIKTKFLQKNTSEILEIFLQTDIQDQISYLNENNLIEENAHEIL